MFGLMVKRKKEVDYPMAVSIWANKYDIWGEKYPLKRRTIN